VKTTSSALDRQARRSKATAEYMDGKITLEQFKAIERKIAPQYEKGVRLLVRSIKQNPTKAVEVKAR
jgi:hypothetical protein